MACGRYAAQRETIADHAVRLTASDDWLLTLDEKFETVRGHTELSPRTASIPAVFPVCAHFVFGSELADFQEVEYY